MALWAGSSLNTNELTAVFNGMISKKPFAMVRKKNGFYYKIIGKSENGANPHGSFKGRKVKEIEYKDFEMRLLGVVRPILTVSDGANEVAAATINYDDDIIGGAKFALAHYSDHHAIPTSEYMRFKGNNAKTLDWFDDVINQYLLLSFEYTIGTALGGVDAPARTTLGGWQYAVDDSVTYDAYGGITRSDSANADFRAYVSSSVGTLTLAKIRTAMNNVTINGGTVDLGVCGIAVYGIIEQLVEAYTHVTFSKEMNEFGGRYTNYAGVDYTLDKYVQSGVLGLLDSSTHLIVKNDYGFGENNVSINPNLQSAMTINWGSWMQHICTAPSWNAKLTGITA